MPAVWISEGRPGLSALRLGTASTGCFYPANLCKASVSATFRGASPAYYSLFKLRTTVDNSDGYIVGFPYETLKSTWRADSKKLSVSLFRLGFHWVNVKKMLALEL